MTVLPGTRKGVNYLNLWGVWVQARHAAFECLNGGAAGDGGSSASSSDMFNNRSSGSASSAEDSMRAGSGADAGSFRSTSPLLHDSRPSSAQVRLPPQHPLHTLHSPSRLVCLRSLKILSKAEPISCPSVKQCGSVMANCKAAQIEWLNKIYAGCKQGVAPHRLWASRRPVPADDSAQWPQKARRSSLSSSVTAVRPFPSCPPCKASLAS